jgi:hypothetical protein
MYILPNDPAKNQFEKFENNQTKKYIFREVQLSCNPLTESSEKLIRNKTDRSKMGHCLFGGKVLMEEKSGKNF